MLFLILSKNKIYHLIIHASNLWSIAKLAGPAKRGSTHILHLSGETGGPLQCVIGCCFITTAVVPKPLQRCTVEKQGHQGVVRYMLRAKSSVCWPGITSQLKQMVQECRVCAQNAHPGKDPILPPPPPCHNILGKWINLNYKDHTT